MGLGESRVASACGLCGECRRRRDWRLGAEQGDGDHEHAVVPPIGAAPDLGFCGGQNAHVCVVSQWQSSCHHLRVTRKPNIQNLRVS